MDYLAPLLSTLSALGVIGGTYLVARRMGKLGVGPAQAQLIATLNTTMLAQSNEIASLNRQSVAQVQELAGCKDALHKIEATNIALVASVSALQATISDLVLTARKP